MVFCEISCRLFGGFKVEIDLNYMDTIEQICEQVKSSLITILQANNLTALVEKANVINFHVHDLEFGTILLMNNDEKIWICNHPHIDQ
tara:strand:- start:447 stop:710 length:264 start_codon:yes stop_codon:yes gene_type:complete